MATSEARHFVDRAKMISALPERVEELEERYGTLEEREDRIVSRLASELEAIREEIAALRGSLAERLEADTEVTELIGRLLQEQSLRLNALERGTADSVGG